MFQPSPPPPAAAFLAGGGAMGARMRAHDWTRTALGPPPAWPAALKTMVRMALSLHHPVFIYWGPSLICLYNDAYQAALRADQRTALLGQPAPIAWGHDWPAHAAAVTQVMRGDGACWHDNQRVTLRRDGDGDGDGGNVSENVCWNVAYSPIYDPDAAHGVGGVVVVCSQSPQQMPAEQRLADEHQRFQALFEQAPTFMAMLRGPTHVFEMVNPRYLQVVAHRPVLGRPVGEALPEAAAQGYVALLDHVYATGQAHLAQSARFEIAPPDGGPPQERFLDFVYQPVRDAAGQVSGIFVEGADVTDRLAAERQLRDTEQRRLDELRLADRRKDEFLAMLAHELRNPLAPIRTAAHLLARPGLSPERLAWCSALLQRQTHTMARLLDDLLEVSRITSGKLELRRERVPVQVVVDAAVEAARPLIDSRQHHLQIDITPPGGWLHVDPTRVAQVLTNLLANAAKYTEPGGRIDLNVRRARGKTLQFEVRDNGIGLSAEHQAEVFRMFFQVDPSRERAQGGLGIGLAMSKGLIDLHGGTIGVESAGLGWGATFRVTLPRCDAPHTAATTIGDDPRPTAAADLSQVTVLIADDNLDSASTMGLLLESEGYAVAQAHDGPEALALAERRHPTVALLDIGMPGLDGYAVAERLRATDWGHGILLVAMTGWGQLHDKQQARDSGFDLHLTKPVSPDDVLDAVARHLAHRLP